MTIDLVAKYLKLRALAERGVDGERDTARRLVRDMETANPAIKRCADKVQKVLDGDEPGRSSGSGNNSSADDLDFLKDILKDAARGFTEDLRGAVRDPERFESLDKGKLVMTEHECADGQVCLEVRMRSKDVRGSFQNGIFDNIEDEILRIARRKR